MGFEPEVLKPTPLWRSCRLTLSFVSFLGFVIMYALRVNLSVAMVCMVNHTYVAQLGETKNNTNTSIRTSSGLTCDAAAAVSVNRTATRGLEGEFAWPKEIQGLLLGAFFWGYLTTQIIGGWMASRFGGKRVFGYFMFVCALATLLMPVGARIDYRLLLALRIIAGICQGVVWPAMQTLWAYWAPPLETGKLTGFCYAGGCGVLWFVVWMVVVFDSPATHPRISPTEREYIQSSLQDRTKVSQGARDKIPWVKILTSKRVWAIAVSHTCANWGTYTFLTNIPTYMKEVLRFDIQKNGALSSLPYIGFWLVINISGNIFDMLQRRQLMNTTVARKVGNSIGLGAPALFVIILGYMDCNSAVWGVVLLTVGVSFSGFQCGSGFLINPGDIAPRFAGIIFGISNTAATIPGFVAPITISLITTSQTQQEWQKVFFIASGIYAFGAIFYIFFGSGQVQEWAQEDISIKVSPSIFLTQSNGGPMDQEKKPEDKPVQDEHL